MAPQPDWYAHVEAGDVLRAPSGDLRLVREVHRYFKEPHRFCITFAIRHKSWTTRPYTTYYYTDDYLKSLEYVGKYRGKLTTIDVLLQKEIKEHTSLKERPPLVTPAQVRGLP